MNGPVPYVISNTLILNITILDAGIHYLAFQMGTQLEVVPFKKKYFIKKNQQQYQKKERANFFCVIV